MFGRSRRRWRSYPPDPRALNRRPFSAQSDLPTASILLKNPNPP
jgi:hypothetical protein